MKMAMSGSENKNEITSNTKYLNKPIATKI